jgi:Uncharacterized membrane-associated protein/domain
MADPRLPPLTESSRAVLRVLAAQGPITRPKLGAILELSKPTMSAAVSELSRAGLVTSFGTYKGATGRTAKIYGLGAARDMSSASMWARRRCAPWRIPSTTVPWRDRGAHRQAEQGDGR